MSERDKERDSTVDIKKRNRRYVDKEKIGD